jgi:DNA-directed RNA polymerase subunit RPC12/RpoP
MPNFKPKTNKKIIIDKNSIVTVDKKHQEIINNFKSKENIIPKLKYKISLLQKEFNSNPSNKILNKIQNYQNKIINIQNKKIDYYLDNSKYIFDYFENKKTISTNNNKKILLNNFFNSNKNNFSNNNDKALNFSKKYLINVDDSFLDINDYIETSYVCECGGEFVPIDHDGIMVCKKCSKQVTHLIENDKPSYKEPPKEVCFYAYKRINHFREILAQFQAKESTQIDDEVIENIKKQVKKERLCKEQLTNNKTKLILKKLGYNKYYEHIPFIKEKLGIKPPTMSIELENTLCNLFMDIQAPYSKYCPNERQNFLNYYYVLYKMCELLGHDEYLEHFYMLKDPVKRMEQDIIWKKICKELNWQFIPTP